MVTVIADSATALFTGSVAQVLRSGSMAAPRGLPTREVLGAHLVLSAPRRRLVDVPPVRVLNPAFAVAEAVWILAGSDSDWIFRFNARLAQFADGRVLRGAYGPRLRRWAGRVDQLDQVRRLLTAEPSSRRAVVQLFDPVLDFAGHRDVPCTIGYRFSIRAGRLHMHTTMRSQDLWLGLPYDVFAATVLQELLAGWLGVELGSYYHHVDSLHLYDQDLDAARRLTEVDALPAEELAPLAVAWRDVDRRLGRLIAGERLAEPGWDELSVVLSSYLAWKAGRRTDARSMVDGGDGVLRAALRRWYDRLAVPAELAHAAEAAW
jgi:thymidylate synthase